MRDWLSKVLDSTRWTPFLKVEPPVEKPEQYQGVINLDEVMDQVMPYPYLKARAHELTQPINSFQLYAGHKCKWKLCFRMGERYVFRCDIGSFPHYYNINKEFFHA